METVGGAVRDVAVGTTVENSVGVPVRVAVAMSCKV